MLQTNQIYLGDCLSVMQEIDDKSVDLILCDLPFGSTKCKWDIIIPFDKLWEQYKRIIKDKGCLILNGTQPFTSLLINSNPTWFKYCWYWKKEKGTGFATSGKRPLNIIEEIVVFSKTATLYNPQRKKLDKPYKRVLPIVKSDSGGKSNLINLTPSGERILKYYEYNTPHNLLEFSRDNANKGVHPTQKPVLLCEYLIKTYTNERDLVLDNCFGSGSTLVAAKNLNRQFIGIEKEEKYFNIAKERLNLC